MADLVFGTGGRFGRLNKSLACSLVKHALNNGITTFDTGFEYARGSSQSLLFNCLSRHIQPDSYSDLFISTKFRPNVNSILSSLHLTLSQLSFRPYIDCLFLWGPSIHDLDQEPLYSILQDLLAQGHIRSVGINTHDIQVMRRILTTKWIDLVDHVMIDYNLLQQDRTPIIDSFSGAGLHVWAGTCLAQGFLLQSLPQMYLRTFSFSYLFRALLNPATRHLLNSASSARRLLSQRYPDISKTLPLSFVCSNPSVSYVPIGMLSFDSINANLSIASSPVNRALVDEASYLLLPYSRSYC